MSIVEELTIEEHKLGSPDRNTAFFRQRTLNKRSVKREYGI